MPPTNWRLIYRLSLFGLAMAFATVFVVPTKAEPLLWLPIFLFCAYVIAKKAPGNPFMHGVLLGVANSLWITAVHMLLFGTYLAHHRSEAAMMDSMPLSPRLMMVIVGPCIGVASGIVIGVFALIAAWILRRRSKAGTS